MKRSRSASLLLMASGTFGLAACDVAPTEPEISVDLYRSVDQCIREAKFTETFCRRSFQSALDEHAQIAPRHGSRWQCENRFGQDACQIRKTSDGHFWVPVLAGYVIPEAADKAEATDGTHPDGAGESVYGSSFFEGRGRRALPVYYVAPQGSFSTAMGDWVRIGPLGAWLSRRAPEAVEPPARVPARTQVVARGGFGGWMGGS